MVITMKLSLRRCISIFLLMFITFLFVPMTSFAQNSTYADISVGSYQDLITAISAAPANGTAYTIKINDNINLTSQLTISSGKNITITSDMAQSGAPFTLTQTATTTSSFSNARHFYLTTGAALTLENVILSGTSVTSNNSGGVYLSNNAGLIMNDGAIIKNCRGGLKGGGVYVYSGTLTLNGGEISGNTASSGGGVYVETGTFHMSKGAINGNTATKNGGGIFISLSSFNMSGGTISNNKVVSDTAGETNSGGGMYSVYGTITMTAGEISGNEVISSAAGTNSYAGGLALLGSSFKMGTDGGSNDNVLILNNTADYMGGGVYAFQSAITMYCGTVSGNKALSGDELTYGGGVEVYTSTFTMKDGIIRANTANDYSGGVEVYGNSTFTMDGGSIIDNTAPRGGGVSVGYGSAAFNMNGGVITGNSATDTGGGAHVYSNGVMTVTSGVISGNSAPYGGGILIDDTGTVKVDNCTITDNTSTAGGGGGIYTADLTYANLTTGDRTVFNGNSAVTSDTPSGDLDAQYPNIRYASVTAPFAHPLNNYDINTMSNIPLRCHITFDSQGGTGIPDQFKDFGETVDRPIDPTKPDHTFYGWWTKDANGEWDYKWDFNTVLVLETHGTELVLFARWDEPIITVSGTVSGLPDNSRIMIAYSTDGGATTNSAATDDSGNYSFVVAYGANVVITPPALSGYRVNPESITIENLSEDSANNDFTYTSQEYSDNSDTTINGAPPKTGDSMNMVFWFTAALSALLILVLWRSDNREVF